MLNDLASLRLMILVFTSTAFTNFVKKHVEITDDGSFNPYLTFLFFAMYVFLLLSASLPLIFVLQGRHVCHALRWIDSLPAAPPHRLLRPTTRSLLYRYNCSHTLFHS